MRLAVLALVSLAGCGGGPVLRNAPRPDPTVMAAGAAAIAGAATLADPDAAARRQEQKKDWNVTPERDHDSRPMPADVLDRLDQAKEGAADEPAAPKKPAVDPTVRRSPGDWMPVQGPPRPGKDRPTDASQPPGPGTAPR